jgi:hypothetical protein
MCIHLILRLSRILSLSFEGWLTRVSSLRDSMPAIIRTLMIMRLLLDWAVVHF